MSGSKGGVKLALEYGSSHNLDNSSIIRMIDLYGNDVLRIAMLYLRDKQNAEDAFQEVFLRVYKNYNKFGHESQEKTWIIRITINVCKDILKKPWYKKILLTDEMKHYHADFYVDTQLIKNERDRFIFEEVLKLPESYKEIIILKYYHDYDNSQISEILGITQSSVRSKLTRARKRLKLKLSKEVYIDE